MRAFVLRFPAAQLRRMDTTHDETTTEQPIIGGPAPAADERPHGDHARALARLREALAATVDGLDPALIHGDTLAEVEASFAALQALARPAPHVPTGAPGRISANPATPFEKIRDGLGRLAG
jgi:hypothetical protein